MKTLGMLFTLLASSAAFASSWVEVTTPVPGTATCNVATNNGFLNAASMKLDDSLGGCDRADIKANNNVKSYDMTVIICKSSSETINVGFQSSLGPSGKVEDIKLVKSAGSMFHPNDPTKTMAKRVVDLDGYVQVSCVSN